MQAYVTIHNATVTTPLLALADFVRVRVPAMSSLVVKLSVKPRLNSVLSESFVDVVEPGLRTVWIGGSSAAGKGPGVFGSWQTVGQVTPVMTCESASK
jgi:hypothetical protein